MLQSIITPRGCRKPRKVTQQAWDFAPTSYCEAEFGLCRQYRGHVLLVAWNDDLVRYDAFIDDRLVGNTEEGAYEEEMMRQRTDIIAALVKRVDDYWAQAN